MAAERLKSPRARLFVALDLPERVREGLTAWQRAECGDPAIRAVAPQALHLTLCFLGHHPEKAIRRVGEIVAAVPRRPIPLRFATAPVPIPRSRPRLYAVGAESEASRELQAELSEALEQERFYRAEKREFWPHVTVARVRPERRVGGSSRRGRGRPRTVDVPPGPLPNALSEPFGAVRLALYRSILKPQGAEYVLLAGVDLPPPKGE